MAKPSVSTYDTNGWVTTNRAREIGEWGETTLRMKVLGTAGPMHPPAYSLCAGNAQFVFTASHTIAIIPVVTWADYPSDTIFEIDSTSGVITSTNSTVQDSFDDEWTDQDHGIEFRWLCTLWVQNRTGGDYTGCYILSSGNGSFWATSAMPAAYFPNITGDISWTLEIKTKYTAHEQVEIKQLESAGSWTWAGLPSCGKIGMGKTQAQFRDISTEVDGDFVSDGIVVNGTSHRRPSVGSVVFDNDRTLTMQCGVARSTIPFFGSDTAYSSGFSTINEAVFSSPTKIAECKIGTTEVNMRLGYENDCITPIEYWGKVTSGDYKCEAYGEDDTISYYCTRTAYNNEPTGCVKATWTDLGMSYKWAGDTGYMDGTGVSPVPEYEDCQGNEWTGDTSDLYVYSGEWSLEMTNVYNGPMSSWSPETTDHVSGGSAEWTRYDPSPAYFNMWLKNPEDYNNTSFQYYDEQTETYVTADDYRIQIPYPRNKQSVGWSINTEVEVDAMDTANIDGVSGWAGVNCDVSVVSGKLRITNITSGAYIYREGFLNDGEPLDPKHFAHHRFALVYALVRNESTQALTDYAGQLVIKRTVGGVDTFTKTFTDFVIHKDISDNPDGALYDLCYPDGENSIDITQSYIAQAEPDDSDLHSAVRKYNEKSAMSWSWGICAFDRIEIKNLTVGAQYDFDGLCGEWVNPGTAESVPHKFGDIVYVNPEFAVPIHSGNMEMTEGDDSKDHEILVSRGAIGVLNGRIAFEGPNIQLTKSNAYVVDIYQNYSLKEVFVDKTRMLPADDFGVWNFTDSIIWDDDWWDSDASEYTTEDVLFCSEVAPMWFLDDCRAYKDVSSPHDNNTTDKNIYVRPVFDNLYINAWWGDGLAGSTRTGYVTIPFVKRLRGRAHGIIWDSAGLTPKEAQPEEANPHFDVMVDNISYETDAVGYYRSAAFDQNTRVHTATIAKITNRLWMRVCGILAGAGTWLCACQSRNVGRIYVGYNKTGAGFYLKIYDHLDPIPVEREISSSQVNSAGIAITDDRKAEIKVVYESGGTVYYITSNDEGKTWSEPVSIVSGGTFPQIAFSPDDGVEIVTYYLTNKARCKRKLGTGSYGAEIEIADAIESVIPIVPARGERQSVWIAFVTQTGNEVKRYKSTDSGRTWALDE